MKTTRHQSSHSGQRAVFETKVSSLNNSFQSIMEVRLTNRINPRRSGSFGMEVQTMQLIPNHTTREESEIVPLKRIAQWLTIKLFGYMARLCVSTHNQNRDNDGQEWLEQSHSLPSSKSGQETP